METLWSSSASLDASGPRVSLWEIVHLHWRYLGIPFCLFILFRSICMTGRYQSWSNLDFPFHWKFWHFKICFFPVQYKIKCFSNFPQKGISKMSVFQNKFFQILNFCIYFFNIILWHIIGHTVYNSTKWCVIIWQ